MENILELQFCIWGTGKYGRIFLNQLEEYIPICEHVFGFNIIDNILYFIDRDKEKQKTKFYDKEIKTPDVLKKDKKFCVVAVLSKDEIYTFMQKQGLINGINFVSSDTFISNIKKEIMKHRKEVLNKYNIFFDLESIKNFSKFLDYIRRSILQLDKKEKGLNNLVKYVIFSLVIDRWENSIDKKMSFGIIRRYFNNIFIVAAYSWYYGNKIISIVEFLCCDNEKKSLVSSSRKQTIGIVVYNYYGGGIEKVVSLLIPLYIKNGHKVVLITDTFVPEKEYVLPLSAVRHTMTYKMDGCLEGRLQELGECIEENNIDIMCFHSGYTHVSTFYDMWYLKILNIPVLMEVHSAFFPVILEKKEMSKYYSYMYKVADKLIVLSNTDKLFWENLGCDCKYIPNPIEDISESKVYNTKDFNRTNTVIWVGRLVQVPKRVLDIVPIMKKVVKVFPKVKLKVYGFASSPWIYNTLVQTIEKFHLEKNIVLCGHKLDIDQIYDEADIVLLTSSSESFCNVIMESKIRGLPMVMYELPWLELLKDGNGYVAVTQGDTEAAADAIIRLLRDDELRESMSIKARESIIPFIRYDVYQDWKDVFDDITNSPSNVVSKNSEFSIIEKMLLSVIFEDGGR